MPTVLLDLKHAFTHMLKLWVSQQIVEKEKNTNGEEHNWF
jgi:hypothetical protein